MIPSVGSIETIVAPLIRIRGNIPCALVLVWLVGVGLSRVQSDPHASPKVTKCNGHADTAGACF
jgi:hypothetical protein